MSQAPIIIILSTGSEITAGRSLDTNSGWIANELFELGWKVHKFVALPDDPNSILEELRHWKEKAKQQKILVIMTGGLGPTEDDYTLHTVLQLTGKSPEVNAKAKLRLERIFKERGKLYEDLLPTVIRQVSAPEDTMILDNSVGIAVGFVEDLGKDSYLVCMPGVPSEMKEMFTRRLVPFLKRSFPRENLLQKTKWIWNLGESLFQRDFIETNLNLLQSGIEWGVTAKRGYIKAIFQATDQVVLDETINRLEAMYKDWISDDVFRFVHESLLQSKKKIAITESCTGGLLGKLLTDFPGSSAYFQGGITTYSNDWKVSELSVPESTLEKFGAVSSETAEAMAIGLLSKTKVDITISITGVAGPDGGTELKPVGTVWIGFAWLDKENNTNHNSKEFRFPGNREGIRENAANTALFLLYKLLRDGEL